MTIPKHLMEAKICNKETCEEIRTLKEELEKKNKKYWQSKCFEYQVENRRLNNVLKVMEKYFELICDLGFDYDGLNNVDSLKQLIDEMIHYASLGRIGNTTKAIYENNNKKYNILGEELKESDK